ncbi:MAG TPA: hypothetical protein VJL07_05705 [Dehalococcoidia bacterium]|nr:hypothetical protein [Dehalococcoidia bacterium]
MISVGLRGPAGDFDISDRVALDAFAGISEEAEITLTGLTHSDLSMTLRDTDGELRRYLTNLGPSDLIYLDVIRSVDARRMKWQRLFQGILDLPWSVSYDPKNQEVELQAFSLTKLLERTPASALARVVTGVTGSVSAPGTSVTVTSTTNILAGDKITLDDGIKDETQTVQYVSSATVLITSAFSNSFTNAMLRLDTPYPRDASVKDLVNDLVAAAGSGPIAVDVRQTALTIPVHQDMATTPIRLSVEEPRAMLWYTQSPNAATGSTGILVKGALLTEFWAPNVRDGFTARAAQYSQGTGDWRPYSLTEPATLVAASAQPAGDGGSAAWDHANGRRYHLNVTLTLLDLYRNGVNLVTVAGSASGFDSFWLDYDPVGDWVWVSYQRAGSDGALKRVRLSDADVAFVVTSAPARSQVRCLRALNAMMFYRPDDRTLTAYALGTTEGTVVATMPQNSYPYLWTLKAGGQTVAVLYALFGRTRMRVWDYSWVLLADFEVHGNAWGGWNTTTTYSNRFPILSVVPDEAEDVYVGYAPSLTTGTGKFFCASRSLVGVVKYADFGDLSCAAAIRELAVASCAILRMDPDGNGLMAGRAHAVLPTQAIPEIPDPIEREQLPISEVYRASVLVKGKTEDGEEFEEIAGDAGDSAHRLEIQGQLVTTRSLAATIANLYASFLAFPRREEKLTIRDDGTLIAALDEVSFDGRRWLVLESSLDIGDQERELRLIELGF